jgi:hypothetical protein
MADSTTASPPASPASPSAGLSKMDLVRKALDKLGKKAKPLAIQSHVKQEFGVDMTADHVSNYKGKILRGDTGKKKAAKPKKAARPKKAEVAKAAAQKTAAPKPAGKKKGKRKAKKKAPKPVAAGGRSAATGLSLQDVQITRDLLGRVGAAQLRSLIDLLAK